ncbi:MAG: hypothetical protein ACJ8EJ_05895, partial [Xanthobacteraceae bacterium]
GRKGPLGGGDRRTSSAWSSALAPAHDTASALVLANLGVARKLPSRRLMATAKALSQMNFEAAYWLGFREFNTTLLIVLTIRIRAISSK